MPPLTAWANFYVIVGSSAGALTGLTFIVITLVAGRREHGTMWGVAAFTSPTAVHFGTVLLLSAILSAPWPSLAPVALLLGLCGLSGMAYGAIVVRRMLRQTNYEPVFEDWLWFAAVPLAAYAALVAMAIMLPGNPAPALFGVGAVMVLLLFAGIRNAWDLVTYIAVGPLDQPGGSGDSKESNE